MKALIIATTIAIITGGLHPRAWAVRGGNGAGKQVLYAKQDRVHRRDASRQLQVVSRKTTRLDGRRGAVPPGIQAMPGKPRRKLARRTTSASVLEPGHTTRASKTSPKDRRSIRHGLAKAIVWLSAGLAAANSDAPAFSQHPSGSRSSGVVVEDRFGHFQQLVHEGNHLFAVGEDGKKRRLMSNVRDFYVQRGAGGKIYLHVQRVDGGDYQRNPFWYRGFASESQGSFESARSDRAERTRSPKDPPKARVEAAPKATEWRTVEGSQRSVDAGETEWRTIRRHLLDADERTLWRAIHRARGVVMPDGRVRDATRGWPARPAGGRLFEATTPNGDRAVLWMPDGAKRRTSDLKPDAVRRWLPDGQHADFSGETWPPAVNEAFAPGGRILVTPDRRHVWVGTPEIVRPAPRQIWTPPPLIVLPGQTAPGGRIDR